MAIKQKVICPLCKREYLRTKKQLNQVYKRTGSWKCKPCATAINGRIRAKKVGSKRIVKASGYIEIKTQDGWRREHMHVMEKHIGRRLKPNEVVHHIDHDITNNKIENLQLMTNGEHTRMHHTGQKRSDEIRKNISNSKLKFDRRLIERAKEMVAGGITQREVADMFGISKMTISRAVRNITYTGELN